MRLRLAIDGHDFSDVATIEATSIKQDSREAISTAELSLIRRYGESRYDHALYDRSAFNYSWIVQEWQQVSVWDQDSGKSLFAGMILSVQRKAEGPHTLLELQCSDFGILFDRAIVTQSWPNGTFDSTIVNDLIRLVPGLRPGTIVPQNNQLGKIEAKDQSARDILDQLCQLTGAEWNVGYDGAVNYYQSGSIVAPFGLSDEPDHEITQPYWLEDLDSDFADAANQVTVLGALDPAGNEIRGSAVDLGSQNQFGALSVTVVDRNIKDVYTATLAAQTQVALRSRPKPTVKASLYVPGLTRGMTVPVTAAKYGIGSALVLRTMEISIIAPDRKRAVIAGHVLKYTATLGWRPPDLVYQLLRMQRVPVDSTTPPPPGVVPGTIDGGDLAAGLQLIQIVATLPDLPNPAYSDTAVVLWTAAPGGPQLYRRTGNTWTDYIDAEAIRGQINAITQLVPGSVTSLILADGSVITAKIPDEAITTAKIRARAIEANLIAANAIYTEALQTNAVTAEKIAASSIIAGKIGALAVEAGNIAADAVTVGTIAAGAIRAQDAVFQTGAIVDADIASLRGTKITANTITSDKLDANELKVGSGGDKPGKISLYNGSSTVVAQLGDLAFAGSGGAAGGTYGIWAKVIAAGGTGYGDAKLRTDVNGNLTITDADFSVTTGGANAGQPGQPPKRQIKTGPTTFDQSYSALALINSENSWEPVNGYYSDSASLVSRGLVLYHNNAVVGAFVRHPTQPNAAQLAFTSPGSLALIIDGFTAQVRADGGFGIAGNAGQTEDVNVRSSDGVNNIRLRFRGGIYIGH